MFSLLLLESQDTEANEARDHGNHNNDGLNNHTVFLFVDPALSVGGSLHKRPFYCWRTRNCLKSFPSLLSLSLHLELEQKTDIRYEKNVFLTPGVCILCGPPSCAVSLHTDSFVHQVLQKTATLNGLIGVFTLFLFINHTTSCSALMSLWSNSKK